MSSTVVKIVWITPRSEDLICHIADTYLERAVPSITNVATQFPDRLSLIEFLIRYNHWKPFEMASLCIEVTTTPDLANKLLLQGVNKRSSPGGAGGAVPPVAPPPTAAIVPKPLPAGDDSECTAAVAAAGPQVGTPLLGKKIYMCCTMRAWVEYCVRNRRLKSSADHPPHADIARAVCEILKRELPVTFRALAHY
jgi:hypothetical protein